ncbi:MAG TPA: glycosyltransferase family 9 protein [Alphaproteobacteria bacterium]|nr:glycosyltransferase family 9 protein [Alphaproteobacteria bacterium]
MPPPAPEAVRRLLVVKLGALGDFILAQGAFAALRRHYAGAHIALLTIPALRRLGEACGHFDEVLDDPRGRSPLAYLAVRRLIRAGRYDLVVDLQCNGRTGRYHRLLWPGRPAWNGTAAGCSLPDRQPDRRRTHAAARYARQMHGLGIAEVPPPRVDFLAGDIAGFGLPARFVLLVPGSAPSRPRKRWPAAAYGELANRLAARGLAPVLLGTAAEAEATAAIAAACPAAIDLTGRSDLFQLGSLARAAAGAVGNDTGPTHILAVAGCPTLALFSDDSDPALNAPVGPDVAVLRRDDLASLDVAAVEAALRLRG